MIKDSITMVYNFDPDVDIIKTSIMTDYKKPIIYSIPNIDILGSYKIFNFFDPLLSMIQYSANFSNNYKYERYNNLMDLLVTEIIKLYKIEKEIIQLDFVNSFFERLLSKITSFYKGQVYLKKLLFLMKDKINKDTVKSYILTASSHGTFGTFMFWLDYYGKNIYNISISIEDVLKDFTEEEQRQIFVNTIGNSDDRIYKYVLKIFLDQDKLFFQKDLIMIKNVCTHLSQNKIPDKYVLKRIKLLSEHISLVPHFFDMVETFSSQKVILKLHEYYYKTSYSFENLKSLIDNLIIIDWQGSITYKEIINKLYELLKTDEEKCMFQIIVSIRGAYSNGKFNKLKLSNYEIDKIIIDNNISILSNLHFDEFMETLNDTYSCKMNKRILYVLSNNNLINKFVDKYKDSYFDTRLLFFTKFLSVSTANMKKHKNIISVNYVLHLLRMKIRKVSKNKIINHKIKMHSIMREIETFEPNNKIPILKSGSISFQHNKQKFNNIPPIHLFPCEISNYTNVLLRDKADGILINNLPIGIYPSHTFINNYQIKAEYIEDLDLYLIFDIDIPKTTIIERYNILREIHSYTFDKKLEKITNFKEFISCLDKERQNINKFLTENKKEQIKWYPKFAVLAHLDDSFRKDIINNVIIDCGFIEKKPYNSDGLIMTPMDESREIKIKPLKLMSIDLLYSNHRWLDGDNKDWSMIINKQVKRDNKIYRCYPNLDNTFTIGEVRYDKKKPNKTHIVNVIINILNYDWSKDIINETYYYQNTKKITNKKLIEFITEQRDNLSNKINMIKPNSNKIWLDLGCGSGKLIPIIKKYSPSYYYGVDIDINQIIKGLKYYNENDNIYHFNQMDISNWTSYIKLCSMNDVKFDYIVANFSIMHFFTNEFFENLNKITHTNAVFIFNTVNKDVDWKLFNSYMKVVDNKTFYKFEWVHNEEMIEPFINEDTIKSTMSKFNWTIENVDKINNYSWWIAKKV